MSVIERALQKSRAELAPSMGRSSLLMPRTGPSHAVPPPPPPESRRADVNAALAEKWATLLHPSDAAAVRAYKILRTQLLRRLEKNAGLVAITAVSVGDGKTVTSLNLALSLARDVNTRVVLVDLDLQRPSIARYLGMSAEVGLDAYLAGRASVNDVFHDIGVERLTVVPTLNPVADSSDALRSPAMMEFFDTLRRQRCVALLDLPPMLLGDDVLALTPHADGVLLVVGEGNTPRSALAEARNVLSEMNVLGVVLNRSAERDDSKYY